MSKRTNWSETFQRAADVEAETPIAVGPPLGLLKQLALRRVPAELAALAKLVELRRRSNGWTLQVLAERVGVSPTELHRLEQGVLGPAILDKLPALARELGLREADVLELAGVTPAAPGRLRQAAQRFVAQAVGVTAPTAGEAEALQEFVRALDTE